MAYDELNAASNGEMPEIKEEKDILDEAKRKQLIACWGKGNNVHRKHEAYKAYECLKDHTNHYVLELLLKQFDLQTVAQMQYAISNVSVLRKVIDKLAKVYANGAKRTMPLSDSNMVPADKAALDAAAANASPNAPTTPGSAPEATPAANPKAAPVAQGAKPAKPAKPGVPPANPADPNAAPVDPNAAPADAAATLPPPIDEEDPETLALEDFCKYLRLDEAMTKANRYLKAMRNTLAYSKPVPAGDGKFNIEVEIKAPYHYDAVEMPGNAKEALAIVLSDYHPERKNLYYLGDAAVAGRGSKINTVREIDQPQVTQLYEAKTQIIANDNKDDGRRWIWWSKNYHFTTDCNGKIVPVEGEDLADGPNGNPILELPFENFAGDQDGSFWADGSRDLVDAGVAINVDLTNYRHIGTTQGYGQMYMTGENLPKSVKVGPTHCVQIEHTKDQPDPVIGFLNSAAPMGDLKEMIEMQVALMLTTNNLSTSAVAANLAAGKPLASGIALMIDRAESVEDIQEQSKIFVEREPKVLAKAAKWWEVYEQAGLLTDEAKAVKPPQNIEEEQVTFPSPQPILSETDQLAVYQLRKTLGLNTMVELIQRDNPGMTVQEAQEKLDKIKAEKVANVATFGSPQMNGAAPGQGGMNGGDQSGQGGGVGQPNNGNAGPGPGQAKPFGGSAGPGQN